MAIPALSHGVSQRQSQTCRDRAVTETVTHTPENGRRPPRKSHRTSEPTIALTHEDIERLAHEAVKRERKYLRAYRGASWVYVLYCKETNWYKIGVTEKSPYKRCRSIGTVGGCTVKVVAYWHGDAKHEAELHRRFASHRVRGEWFRRSQEMEDYLRDAPGISQNFLDEVVAEAMASGGRP